MSLHAHQALGQQSVVVVKEKIASLSQHNAQSSETRFPATTQQSTSLQCGLGSAPWQHRPPSCGVNTPWQHCRVVAPAHLTAAASAAGVPAACARQGVPTASSSSPASTAASASGPSARSRACPGPRFLCDACKVHGNALLIDALCCRVLRPLDCNIGCVRSPSEAGGVRDATADIKDTEEAHCVLTSDIAAPTACAASHL